MARSIAPTASVSERATLGEDVIVGHGTIVYDNVVVGDGTVIGEFCVVGHPSTAANGPLRIGPMSLIRSHTVLYLGASLGPKLETGHHAVIRENCRVGANLRIGSYSSLEGEVDVGDFVRIYGHSQIGRGTALGDFVWLYSLVTCANDPLPPSNIEAPCRIGAGAVAALNAQLLCCRIGEAAFVSAGALVHGEVPAGEIVRPDGSLGGPVSHLLHLESGTRHPWFRHLTGHYPPEAEEKLQALRNLYLTSSGAR